MNVEDAESSKTTTASDAADELKKKPVEKVYRKVNLVLDAMIRTNGSDKEDVVKFRVRDQKTGDDSSNKLNADSLTTPLYFVQNSGLFVNLQNGHLYTDFSDKNSTDLTPQLAGGKEQSKVYWQRSHNQDDGAGEED
jgi:hypothetical protein